MFGTSRDYHELNAGAHRNSPKNLYAPALTWHLAVWIERDLSEEAIKLKIDGLILTLCRGFNEQKIDFKLLPCVADKVLLFRTVADQFNLAIVDPNFLTPRQQDIFKSGSRGVYVIYKWMDLDKTIKYEFHTEYFTITSFVELDKQRKGPPFSSDNNINQKIMEMLKYLRDPEGIVDPVLNGYFFGQFWEMYLNQIQANVEFKRLCKDKVFCHVFADFRGIILSEEAVAFAYDQAFFEDRAPPSWGAKAKKKFLPLLRVHPSARLRNYESVINYIAGGRALYMSTLAPQLPEAPVETRIPLQYIIYAHQHDPSGNVVVNKWQLGRIVSQFHYLGSSRLAALKDIKSLHDAGKALSRLDETMQKARESIATNQINAMGLIQDAHRQLNAVTGDFLTDAKCGLLYRIERSRYYVSRFKLNVPMLRIEMLEGDQPYDQFIERRIGSQFDYVNRLGTRFERATNNINLLDQHYIAMRTAMITEEGQKTNRTIQDIQAGGEFFLIGALVPYYVSHLIGLLFQDHYMPLTAIIVWGFFLTVAVYRASKDLTWGTFVAGAVVIILVFMSIPETSPKDGSWSFPSLTSEHVDWEKQLLEEQKGLRHDLTEQRERETELLDAIRRSAAPANVPEDSSHPVPHPNP